MALVSDEGANNGRRLGRARASQRPVSEADEPGSTPNADPVDDEPAAVHVSRARTLAGVAFVLVVVAAAVAAIVHDRHAFGRALDQIGAGAVIASGLAALVSTSLTFFIWRAVLGGLGVDLPTAPAARVFFTSQLGKYLPGSVWPVVMQMEAGRAHGAQRRTMLTANVITLVLSCAVGLVIACVFLPLSDAHALSRYWWLLIALPFLLVLLHPRAVPYVVDRIFRLLGRPALHERLPVRQSALASGWSALSFAAQGLHVAILVTAIDGWHLSTLLLCLGGMALAVCAGVLFIPAVAGVGIREIVLKLVLATVLTSPQAFAVVVMSRVLLTAVDLLLAAAAAVGHRRPNMTRTAS
jgi:glycosyltransferase 2 family protein